MFRKGDAQHQPPAHKPVDKILVITLSVRSFRYSWWSLIPFVGLIAAFGVFRCNRRVRQAAHGEWNVAQNYLRWASAIARLGCLISLLSFGALLAAWIERS